MPYKHQASSYRTIGGKRWASWGDWPWEDARLEQIRLREQGIKSRRVNIGDEMFRVFIPDGITPV